MKKLLCKLMNKTATVYGGAVSNASLFWLVGQAKTPSFLIKK